MDAEGLRDWLDAYGRAWISNDPDQVAALFAEDARYWTGPFGEPWEGRARIVAEWTSDPAGQRDVTWEAEPLAALGNTGIAHWRVGYTPAAGPGTRVELDGILLLRFDGEDRCLEHREWYHRREGPV